MLTRAVVRSLQGPVALRHAQTRSFTSINSQTLGRTSVQLSPISSPWFLRTSLPSFQSRSYAKSKNKRPFQHSPPTQLSNSKGTQEPQTPIEPATISARSRAAAATEGGLDGTELADELSDTSKPQADHEEIAKAKVDGQPHKEQRGSPTSSVDSSRILSDSDYLQPQNEFQKSSPQDSNAVHQSLPPSATDPTDAPRQEPERQQATRTLPDLTQGIPSTLDAEMARSSSKSHPENLNMTDYPPESDGKGGGDLPKSAYISSFERRRNRFANYFYACTLFAAISGAVVLGRNWETPEEEEKHKDAPNGWGLGLFYNRASARLAGMLDYYNEPAFPKLLPNTDPAWERPYTLVLSLEDMLVHSEWDREHGWRMAKRPGVDYFLRYLSQYYELVIFTSVPSMIGQPIISKLDPYHIVMWPLFREATRYKKGEYIKDLSYLNRPLNKIIMLDTNSAHARLQPENAIIINKWKGDLRDKELVSFIPFLEYVASMQFNDTREVLKSFEGKHIPVEFAKREAVAREKFMQQLAADKAKGRGGRSMSGLGSLLGMKTQGDGTEQSLSEGFAQGKTFQDQVRERGQKGYEMLEKEIRENGEKWLKEMAEEEKKMNEEAMKGMKNSITGVFPFAIPGKGASTSPTGSLSASSGGEHS